MTLDMILPAISRIKSDSKGVDDTPIKYVKLSLPIIFPVLLNVFNCSFYQPYFPNLWKISRVRSLSKIKHPQNSSDYRPISLLCSISKALERIVHLHLCEYLDSHNFTDKNQSGFRSFHSTQTLLIRISDDI